MSVCPVCAMHIREKNLHGSPEWYFGMERERWSWFQCVYHWTVSHRTSKTLTCLYSGKGAVRIEQTSDIKGDFRKCKFLFWCSPDFLFISLPPHFMHVEEMYYHASEVEDIDRMETHRRVLQGYKWGHLLYM